MRDVYVAPPGSYKGAAWAETYTGEDSPIGRDMIAINDRKFIESGAGPRYREKMIAFESLHRLKDKAPAMHKDLFETAMKDPKYRQWARESYEWEKENRGETRPFAKWHRVSRFDQVVSGYIFAGDPDIPSMKNWKREDLPIGRQLRSKLEKLRHQFDDKGR